MEEFIHGEWAALHFVISNCIAKVFGLNQETELAMVQFWDEDFLKSGEDVFQVIWEWIEVFEDNAADFKAFGLHSVDSRGDGSIGAAPTENEEFAGVVSVDFSRWEGVGNGFHFVRPDLGHVLVVKWIVTDASGFVLFQAADAVFITFHSREG